MRAITSSTSASAAIRRAAGPSRPGNTGWSTMRPASRSSRHRGAGKKKWAAWSPWRWPISRPPTLKANSPRRPGPAVTPGHEVTVSVMRRLGVAVSDMPPVSGPGPRAPSEQFALGRPGESPPGGPEPDHGPPDLRRGLAEPGAARRPAGGADPDLEVRRARLPDHAAPDPGDRLAGPDVGAHGDERGLRVPVVDVPAPVGALVDAQHRGVVAEPVDALLHDGAVG